jgi:hypothetical protein
MEWLAGIVGIALVAVVLWDAFEIILLPRRTAVRWRISRFILTSLWWTWSGLGRRIERRNRREDFLGLYALLALIGLLVVWASGLIFGFALLFLAGGTDLTTAGGPVGFRTDLYMSGTTFFTLGLGDVAPASPLARFLAVAEAGTGFGFLALVLAYLPVLYQSFSRRETRITMLDEWSGSPPTAAVLLRRCFESREPDQALRALLKDWEIAAAEILESHLSYPILAFFRSQHDNQSWLAALTAVMDTCALAIVGIEGIDPFQPRLTFAIGRHTLVDVSQILRRRPRTAEATVRAEPVAELRTWLESAGVRLAAGPEADRRLAELRALYEPYVEELSRRLVMPLPPWLPPDRARYNWETTAWARTGRMDAH